jgi:putative transposase
MELISRKRIRLAESLYTGRYRYFITICCHRRQLFFSRPHNASRVIDFLCKASSQMNYALHAWCVMPDHIHILVEGTQESCELVAFVRKFKQATAYSFKVTCGKQLWQRSFYDHVLRQQDELGLVAQYIWMNPVRKGLCELPNMYAFSGSLTMNLSDNSVSANSWTPPWKQP